MAPVMLRIPADPGRRATPWRSAVEWVPVGGPYTKVTTSAPWFASDADVAGPGGQEWFTDSTGQLRMAYHGWTPGHVGYPGGGRSLRLATVDLSGTAPSAF